MGNSVRRFGLLSTVGIGGDEPFHYQLGTKVSIDLSRRQFKVKRSGSWSEKWIMSYTLGVSTCTLSLTRSGGKNEDAKGLLIDLLTETSDKKGNFQEYGFHLDVQTVIESDALLHTNLIETTNGNNYSCSSDGSKQIHAGGSVTDTNLVLFGTGEIGVFIVLEMKKKVEEEQPYAVTLAHYFATSAGIRYFPRTKTEVGLSVVAKIRASNGNLDIAVEGPDQHPAAGLRYLFDEAMRTKIWKPTLCPHCANIRKPRSTMIWQSDSEDSESVPVARRRGGNGRGIDNGGRFNGDGNANYIENYNNYFGERWSGKK